MPGFLCAVAGENYRARTRLAEHIAAAAGWQNAVAQYRASHGSRPGADEARTLFRQPLPSRVARHVQLLDQGVLAIATDGPATAGPVHLVPYVNGRGDVLWQCRGDRPPRQLPSGCTTTR